MKHLSHWAKRHPLQARIIIVAAHSLAMLLSFEVGIWLYAQYDLAWPVWAFPALLALMAWVRNTYPVQHSQPEPASGVRHQHYRRTRRALAGATLCAWTLVLLVGNHEARQSELPEEAPHPPSYWQTIPVAQGQMPLLMTESNKSVQVQTVFKWLKTKKKAQIQKRVQQFRRRSNGGDIDAAGQVLLTLLVILLAAGLEMLVLALACNLSCAGQEAVALIVGLFGTGLILWGAIAAIIAIWRKSSEGAYPPPGGESPPKRPPSKKL